MVKPTPATPEEGTRLGRYRLRYKVAQGGMAAVYLAQLEGLHGFERWVATKIVHPHLSADRRFTTMLFDEARVSAQIHHPNVCAVIDYGEEEGSVYLVMEYLHGESFASVIRRSMRDGELMPFWLAVRVCVDAARGLHAAHELRDSRGGDLGVVHRDVSPQNILVLYDGMSKVVDFGIARARGRLTATEQGETKGKFAYMSPEQLQTSAVDRRTDIWALGVVLWEATVGKRLFRAESQGRTVMRVVAAPIPKPSSVRNDYPERLESIVMRALDRDPEKRWQTASDMADALEAYLYSGGEPAGAGRVATWMRDNFPDKLGTRNAMLRSTPGVAAVPEVELESQSTIGSHQRASVADASAALADEEASDMSEAADAEVDEGGLPARMGDFSEEPGEMDRTVADAVPPSEGPKEAAKPAASAPPPAVPWPATKSTPPDEAPTEQVTAPPGEPALNAADTIQIAPISSSSIELPKLRESERPPMSTIPRRWVAAGAVVGLLLVIGFAVALSGDEEAAMSKRAGPKLAPPPTGAVVPAPPPATGPAEAAPSLPAKAREPAPRAPSERTVRDETEAPAETTRAPEPSREPTPPPAEEAETSPPHASEDSTRSGERSQRRPQREARPPAEPGTLNLLAVPRAEVFRGPRRLGTTPLVDFELPAGAHRLVLRELGGSRQRVVRIEIRPGQRTAMSVRLDE